MTPVMIFLAVLVVIILTARANVNLIGILILAVFGFYVVFEMYQVLPESINNLGNVIAKGMKG